jgi:hypothetical protein
MTLTRRFIACSVFFLCLFWCTPSANAGPSLAFTGRKALLEQYLQIKPELEKSEFGIPFFLDSHEERHALRGDVYCVIEHRFDTVADVLEQPRNWCDIASLHLNIKACTYKRLGNKELLVVYSGRKFYQPPEEVYKLEYEYRILMKQSEYLRISLAADEGPLRTKDYRIELEAAPLDDWRSLIHFSYAYRYGLFASMAMEAYFRTLGHDKVGFSAVNDDSEGNAIYIRGSRGAIERNVVRYYFAIQAYMDTLRFPEEERFHERICRWYDLTEQYPRQLFEMGKEEYLSCKIMEHENQLMLQREMSKDD